MRNLGTLFGYEMKKIWKRKLMWVALLTTVVVSVSGVMRSFSVVCMRLLREKGSTNLKSILMWKAIFSLWTAVTISFSTLLSSKWGWMRGH